MKKVFTFILLVFLSFDISAQMQVKEGSFRHIPNAVMDDKYEHTDGNDLPMALIKISTENIPEQERLKLIFSGNRATQIVKTPKTGQMWIYITANSADFIDIKHPDYGTCKYYLPEQLCDFCTYEMVVLYIDPTPVVETGLLAISSEPNEADVYVDGKHYGKTMTVITDLAEGSHTLKLEKQGYVTLTKNIVIQKGGALTINERLQIDSPKISEDRQQTSGKINGHEYVDLGLSVKWATCNVGANKPEDYGDYFAWGETTIKSDYSCITNITYNHTTSHLQSLGIIDANGNLTSSRDVATANWGGTWRMPTETECEELLDNCTWKWTTQNGVKGYKVIGTNGNSIFLPATIYNFTLKNLPFAN